MKNLLLIVSLFALTLGTIGCKKNRTLNMLEGDWEVTSFTEDGTELMGNNAFVSAFTMEFDEYESDEGDFTWTLVDVQTGQTTVITGEYECNEAGDELEFRFVTGPIFNDDIAEFNFDIDGDELTMDGNIDGFRYEIEADKD